MPAPIIHLHRVALARKTLNAVIKYSESISSHMVGPLPLSHDVVIYEIVRIPSCSGSQFESVNMLKSAVMIRAAF